MQWTHFIYRNYYSCEDWTDIYAMLVSVARGIILTLIFSIVMAIIHTLICIVHLVFNKRRRKLEALNSKRQAK